jgi:long-chain acyl-CoA synthetase
MVATDSGRQQVQGAVPAAISPGRHATSWLWDAAGDTDRTHVLRFPVDPDGRVWDGLSRREVARLVRAVAAGLVNAGVGPGDRVALMSPTRYEWTVVDLAVLSAGAVTVPVYDTSSPEQCEHIVRDSGAVLVVAGDAELAGRFDGVRDELHGDVLVLADGALDRLAAGGIGAEAEVTERLAALGGDDLATIVYTSGTTGAPKGCRLTHGNLAWTMTQTRLALHEVVGGGGSTVLFLPLAHVFTRLVQFVCLEAGIQIAYARSLAAMKDDVLAVRPTFLLAVPRVFQKVYEGAERQATGWRRRVFAFATRTAEEWSSRPDPDPWIRVRREVADLLVYRRIRTGLGGRVTTCLSGGAPLAPHLAHFFHAAGITVLEGYGLTETTAPVSVDTPSTFRPGTVGPPLPGVDVRLADDGEILVRGGNVFAGYHGKPEETREVLDADGWFRTGDIGAIDAEGRLRITDRAKEVIVTSSGKNVAPAALEERIKASPVVSQAMVVGDDRPFIGALVTIDEDAVAARSGEIDLRDEVAQAVETANRSVSRAESIREFRILDRDFSEDEGELTPTMKLRRKAIEEHFHDEIDTIYTGSSH